MKLNLTKRLQIGFGITIVILAVSSVLSFVSIKNLLESSKLVDHSNLVVSDLEQVLSVMKDGETGQRGFLLTNQEDFLKPYNGAIDKANILLSDLEKLSDGNAEQTKKITEIKALMFNRFKVLKDLIDKKRNGIAVSVDDLRAGKVSMDQLRLNVKDAENLEKSRLQARTDKLNEISNYTPVIIAFAAILAILVSLYFYFRVLKETNERAGLQEALEANDREMNRRLNIIKNIAELIASGDYSPRIEDSEKDSLGILSQSLNKMASSLEVSFTHLSENEWMQNGIAGLNDQMIGEKDIPILAKDILEYIAGTIHCQAEALYLEENNILQLEGSYALKNHPTHLKLGEGLVGQAAVSKELISLKNIDENNILINYASGTAKANNIIISPIIHERKLVGVLELASIEPFSELEITYIKNVSVNMGIAFTAARSHRQLQELLEETQTQTEELQAQHCELENLNSELEEHANKLQSSEVELLAQQEELLQANNDLEERNRLINIRNAEIQEKAKELERSTKYKSEFMANMSHELRTPLNSILLLSRYLSENSENNLNEEQIESAGIILNSGSGLLNLIDELLDLSKIEAGKMELEYSTVSLDEMLVEIQSLFTPIAKERNLPLILRNEVKGFDTIETDRMRLDQILKNLLSNALKFTTKGNVTLTIANNTTDKDHVEFIVSDTGIGIPGNKQALVFDAFQQADGSTKRKFGGTGLGLSISKELVKLLGGEISLSSEEGKGSTFIVKIPRDKTVINENVPELTIHQVAANNSSSSVSRYLAKEIPNNILDDRELIEKNDKTILIVEDDTVFAKTLLKFSHSNGYKAIIAVRGDDGVSLAKQYQPSAILLDIHLPVMDGWEVMEFLKEDPHTRHIPIHVMSSLNAKRESRMKGAVDFIHKPVAVRHMKQMFQKLEEAMKQSPKKVLIIEENKKHAQALSFFLDTCNVSTAISSNVSESIMVLQNKEVDCVIMDMGLPSQNAYETLEVVKSTQGLEDLPIIVFTGKSISIAEESRLKKYADSIVVKTAHSYQRILDEVGVFLHVIEKDKVGNEKTNNRLNTLNEILKGKTVLIADDDARNIFSITKYLEKYGMNVISATDGEKALEQLDIAPNVDIILMDMMMPNMDGYESITQIRQSSRHKDIPIISVTAKAMLGDREKCITAGASDYVSKPVDIDQLISLLRIWLY